jgi:hypothetical protein
MKERGEKEKPKQQQKKKHAYVPPKLTVISVPDFTAVAACYNGASAFPACGWGSGS